ncbi:MAG: 2-amino-4-hydroxy-6-hydroxymethyldihydropteridine diphosphokinase [Thermoguttaceae bacterium]
MMPVCLIGLGSNQGDRRAALDRATDCLAAHPHIHAVSHSTWRETAPVGGPKGQTAFLNGAVRIETSLDPHELLDCLQEIENQLGRRRAEHWGPRTIDLDLLLYDERTIETPSLTAPHPRLAFRRFVLEPAAEVAPTMRHPKIGWSIARLLEHINTTPRYVAIAGSIGAGKTHLAQRLADELAGQLIAEQPDWTRLDKFYADTGGLAWQTELEFLRHRADLLTTPKPPNEASWTLTDFWFEQSAAFARVWLSNDQQAALLRQQEQWLPTVPRPRLVVLLTAPAKLLASRVSGRGRPCERRLSAEQLERIQQAVIEQTARQDVGPVLRLSSEDADAAFAEALAAVRGME